MTNSKKYSSEYNDLLRGTETKRQYNATYRAKQVHFLHNCKYCGNLAEKGFFCRSACKEIYQKNRKKFHNQNRKKKSSLTKEAHYGTQEKD